MRNSEWVELFLRRAYADAPAAHWFEEWLRRAHVDTERANESEVPAAGVESEALPPAASFTQSVGADPDEDYGQAHGQRKSQHP